MPNHVIIDKVLIALALLQLDREQDFCAVVDVGAGTGLSAQLIRHLLPGRYWHAIEADSACVETFHLKSLYDTVHVSDVRHLDMQTLPKGGVALLGSLLEQMSLEEAIQTIERLLTVNDYVFLSVRLQAPLSEASESGSSNGRSHLWTGEDLALLPGGTHAVCINIPNNPSYGQIIIMACVRSEPAQISARHSLTAAMAELVNDAKLMQIYNQNDPSNSQPFHQIYRHIIQKPSFEATLTKIMQRLSNTKAGELDHASWHPKARQQWFGFLSECYNSYCHTKHIIYADKVICFFADHHPNKPELLEPALELSLFLCHWERVHQYATLLLAKNPTHLKASMAKVRLWHQSHGKSKEILEMVTIAKTPPTSAEEEKFYLQNLYYATGSILFSDLDEQKMAWANALIQDARGFQCSPAAIACQDARGIQYNGMLKDFFDTLNLAFIMTPMPEADPWPDIAFASSAGLPLHPLDLAAIADRLQSKLVFLVSADELYINRYANSYITSTLRTYEKSLIVVCVVGGIHRLNEMAARVSIEDERLIFCGDLFDPAVAGSYHPRVYYQTARYRWIAYLMDHLPLPFIVNDIDIVVQHSIEHLPEKFSAFDVVVNEEKASLQVQSRIIANLVLFNQTATAKLFARSLRAYINTALRDNRVLGLVLDQIAMVMARQHVQRFSNPKFGRFAPFDINNVMFTKKNVHAYRELSKQFCFLALYASQEDVINDKKWWMESA